MTEPEERDRPFTLDEARRIVGYLRGFETRRERDRVTYELVADIYQLALMTGMRQGEWSQRRWAQVDFDAELVRLTKTKGGKSRSVMLNRPVRAILKRRYRERGASPYVFPSQYKADHPVAEHTIRRLLKKAANALKIPYGRKVEGGFTFHDTRHMAVTNMLLDGHDLATVADVSGHSKKEMTLKYSHATAESRSQAVASLEKFDFGVSLDDKRRKKKWLGCKSLSSQHLETLSITAPRIRNLRAGTALLLAF
jgi:integrase